MDRKQQIHPLYFAAAFTGLMPVQSWLSQASVTQCIPYSAFLDHLESGQNDCADQFKGQVRWQMEVLHGGWWGMGLSGGVMLWHLGRGTAGGPNL